MDCSMNTMAFGPTPLPQLNPTDFDLHWSRNYLVVALMIFLFTKSSNYLPIHFPMLFDTYLPIHSVLFLFVPAAETGFWSKSVSQNESGGSLTSLLTSLDDLVILSNVNQCSSSKSCFHVGQSGSSSSACSVWILLVHWMWQWWTSDAHPLARLQCLSHCGQKWHRSPHALGQPSAAPKPACYQH